ncbi:hypothetical protein [Paenibacillus taiwanensis]|uniref:hypothetical protein n=1 Tax=Paenibacillus taiwanensis TaxID=401638 RepID=UPI0003FC8161|nr:hypothetical protein [Paenibacillus taiwanensis]
MQLNKAIVMTVLVAGATIITPLVSGSLASNAAAPAAVVQSSNANFKSNDFSAPVPTTHENKTQRAPGNPVVLHNTAVFISDGFPAPCPQTWFR